MCSTLLHFLAWWRSLCFVRFPTSDLPDPRLSMQNFGYTALHYAANHDYSAVIDALLRHGAEVNAKDRVR